MRSILIVAIVVLSACVSEPLPDGFKDSDDFDPIAAAKNRISLGLTYLQNGNFSQAKFNLDKALQFAPRLADAHFSMAYYYQRVDESELADDAYQKAIAFAPKNPDIANSYGAFLCAKGDYKEAKKYFLKAVNSSNYISTAETYENLALCSQSQGQIEDALTYLQSAINHQPSRGKSLLLLVELQMQQQQWQGAKENLRRYEKVARVTPDTLWKSIEIENALNNVSLAKGYGDMLIRMYPSHPRTLAYIKSKRDITGAAPSGKITKQLKPSANITTSEPKLATQVSKDADSKVSPTPNEMSEVDTVAQNSVIEKAPEMPATPTVSTDVIAQTQQVQSSEKPSMQEGSMALGSQDPTPSDSTLLPSITPSPETKGSDINESQSVMTEAPEVTNELDKVEAVVNNSEVENIAEVKISGEPLADSAEQVHIVQKGENLYRISLRYNVKMKRLLEWNGLEEGEAIPIGKRLMVVDPATVE